MDCLKFKREDPFLVLFAQSSLSLPASQQFYRLEAVHVKLGAESCKKMDERAELVAIDENKKEYITWKSFPERNSHDDFLYTNRNWPGIEKYWGSLIAKKSYVLICLV